MSITAEEVMSAPILYDGAVREAAAKAIKVYRMQLSNVSNWFVAEPDFSPNGCDFAMKISRFGLVSKNSAGGIGTTRQRQFDTTEADLIRVRICSFFTNDESKPFSPYIFRRARCLSVVFAEDWILLKNM